MHAVPGSRTSSGRKRIVAFVFALISASQAASPHQAPTQNPPSASTPVANASNEAISWVLASRKASASS